LKGDIVGLQEVVFGAEQLDELKVAKDGRHEIVEPHTPNYNSYEAACQIPIFDFMKNPDPRAKLDGNALLVRPGLESLKVVSHEVLHLSAARNCQLLKFEIEEEDSMSGPGEEPRYIYFVNTHLHSIITDDFVRLQQA